MRIKIITKIIEKTKPNKTNYSHETYSMILNNLSTNNSSKIHKKEKFFRLLTFTNIFINKDQAHFYVAGEDGLIMDLLQHFEFSQLIRIDDMVLKIKNIELINNINEKPCYKFKTKLIINIVENGKTTLSDDFNYIQERLRTNAIKKANQLGFEGDINFKIINPQKQITRYKNGHINSWKCGLNVTGDKEIVDVIYNVGVGENTASGHGFLWEVS